MLCEAAAMNLPDLPDEKELFELAVSTGDGCERICGSREPQVALLAVAAFQLQAAAVGARMATMAGNPAYTASLREVAGDYGGVASASINLAVRSAVTATDLCAAAAGRLAGRTPGGTREMDAAEFAKFRRRDGIPPIFERVADQLIARLGTDIWKDTEALRAEVTHKRYNRGIYATTKARTDQSPLAFPQHIDIAWGKAGMTPLDVVCRTVVIYATDTFRQFCAGIAAMS